MVCGLIMEKLVGFEYLKDQAFCCSFSNDLELPSLSLKLKKLEINNIGWNALNLYQGTSTSNCCNISKVIPLGTLEELPSLPSKLKKLEIDNIWWKALYLYQGTSTSNCCSI